DQRSVEVVYAICSLPFEHARPTAIMTWMRQHWGIENSLHWIRDVIFDEDRQRAHTGNGVQVLATLRNTAINLHRLNGADNIAEALLINNAGALGVIRSHARASRETTLLCACLNKAAASAFFESKL
ncbi:transposase, partial [Mycobacterium ulcerans]